MWFVEQSGTTSRLEWTSANGSVRSDKRNSRAVEQSVCFRLQPTESLFWRCFQRAQIQAAHFYWRKNLLHLLKSPQRSHVPGNFLNLSSFKVKSIYLTKGVQVRTVSPTISSLVCGQRIKMQDLVSRFINLNHFAVESTVRWCRYVGDVTSQVASSMLNDSVNGTFLVRGRCTDPHCVSDKSTPYAISLKYAD